MDRKQIFCIDPHKLGLAVDKLRPVGEFWCYCIFESHSEAKASFNPITGVIYCHKCKKSASLKEILNITGGIVERRIFKLPDVNANQIEWIHLLNNKLALNNSYLNKRKVSEQSIKLFNILETESSILIPLKMNNKITGIIERKYSGNIRYIFYGRQPPVFPYDMQYDIEKPVYLVEGVFGVINALQNDKQAYCIFGTNVNKYKIKHLTNYNLIGAFDNDEAGHIAARELIQLSPSSSCIYPGIEADETDWNLDNFLITRQLNKFRERAS